MAVVKKVRIGATTVHFKISSLWRAGSKQRRQRLQRAIDQDAYPFHNLSHTTHVGGYAWAKRPVGFDLELSTRQVSERAIDRVATAKEQELCDHSGLMIWVMKEAAFKALRGERQPKTITAITITAVKKKKNSKLKKTLTNLTFSYEFSYKCSDFNCLRLDGQGRCLAIGRTIVGIAIASA